MGKTRERKKFWKIPCLLGEVTQFCLRERTNQVGTGLFLSLLMTVYEDKALGVGQFVLTMFCEKRRRFWHFEGCEVWKVLSTAAKSKAEAFWVSSLHYDKANNIEAMLLLHAIVVVNSSIPWKKGKIVQVCTTGTPTSNCALVWY